MSEGASGDERPQPVVQSQFREIQGRFSPDVQWIAYVSNESGRDEVYVRRFPDNGTKIQISANGAYQPRWRRDGKELFFLSGTREVMAVDINSSTARTLRAGSPQKLFTVNPVFLVTQRNTWDVAPDGQRFLINSALTPWSVVPIRVVLNWSAGTGKYNQR
jgi:hypothetical protein